MPWFVLLWTHSWGENEPSFGFGPGTNRCQTDAGQVCAAAARPALLCRRGVARELLGDLGGFVGAADAFEDRDRLAQLGRGILALALQQIGLKPGGARQIGRVVL